MDLIIRSVRIIDQQSPHNNSISDILIENGIIQKIVKRLPTHSKIKEINAKGLHVSCGWVDINTHIGEPGYEHRETFRTAIKAAQYGGFTTIAVAPDSNPVVDGKTSVEYVRNQSQGRLVDMESIGTLSARGEGKDLSEMLDMRSAGAIGFTNVKPKISNGLLQRALEYVKPYKGFIIANPYGNDLEESAVMNESFMSASLGMKGMPNILESASVDQYLKALEYTESRLHILNVTTKESVALIKNAKKKGLNVTCSVNPIHLCYTDEELADFDTNFKLNPPLRSKTDQNELIKGIKDGTIDCFNSQHQPVEMEHKKVTFQQAEFGMINLETAFSLSWMALSDKIDESQIIDMWSTNSRKILGLKEASIVSGQRANLTLFDPKLEYTYLEKDIASISKNTPLIDKQLVGKPIAVINNNSSFISKI